MAKKINPSEITCSEVQKILCSNADSADQTKIYAHLNQCPECKAYKETVNSLEKIYSVDNEASTISPKKSIKKNLVRSMQKKMREKDSLWDSLWRLFEYRIPVYQAVTGAAIIFIIFFAAQNISWGRPDQRNVTYITNEIEVLDFPDLYVLDSLKMRSMHNMGRNALEDSAITKYMVTAL